MNSRHLVRTQKYLRFFLSYCLDKIFGNTLYTGLSILLYTNCWNGFNHTASVFYQTFLASLLSIRKTKFS